MTPSNKPGWLAALSLLAISCQSASLPPLRSVPSLKQEHYVSPPQLARAGAMTDRRIPSFSAPTADGSALNWETLLRDQPVVVIFIKKDCPCSDEFEPFFQRLERAYRGSACFIAVIDGDVAAARQFTSAHHTPYPVLADPDLRIVRRFEAEHGSYVALARADGTLAALWPGLSTDMMKELSSQIAHLAGMVEPAIEVSDLPKAMMTGCPYLKE